MQRANQWLLISAFTVSDPIWPFHQFDSTILIYTPQFIPPPPIYCWNSVILPNWPPEFKGVSSKKFFDEMPLNSGGQFGRITEFQQ